jgi:hypothetical protein
VSTELKTRMENSLKSKGLTYDELDSSNTPLTKAILSCLMELIRIEDRINRVADNVTIHLGAIATQLTSGRTDHGHTAGALLARTGDIVELMATWDGYRRQLSDLITVYKSQPASK